VIGRVSGLVSHSRAVPSCRVEIGFCSSFLQRLDQVAARTKLRPIRSFHRESFLCLLYVENHDDFHHRCREEEEILHGGPKAAKQPLSESPHFPRSDHSQGQAEDVVRYGEDPADCAQVEPRPPKECEERSGHHG
jgi:hypothetical protein